MNKDENKNVDNKISNAAEFLPGAGIDVADSEKVTENLVDERTKTENDNPRDHDLF